MESQLLRAAKISRESRDGAAPAPCWAGEGWRVLPLRRRYAQLMRNSQHHLGLVRNVTQAYPFESLVLWTACASPQNVDRLGFLSPLQAQGEGHILEKKAPAAGAIPAAEPDSCSQAWPTSGRSAHGWRTTHLAVTVAAFLSFLLQQPSPRNSCMGGKWKLCGQSPVVTQGWRRSCL